MTGDRPAIWVLDGSIAVTGALISARDMARALRDDADVSLVIPDGAAIDPASLTDFAAVHRLPIRALRRRLWDVVFYLPALLWATLRLRRLMARHGVQTLLVNDFYLLQGLLLRGLGYRGRILTWVRIDPAAFGRVGRFWLWLALRLSDRVVAVSGHIERLLPMSEKTCLIYDPISAEFLPAPRPSPPEGRDFVFLGNYIEGKGQDLALIALAEVIRFVPQARLKFFGGDMGLEKNRDYRRRLERQADELGVARAVCFGEFAPAPRAVLEGGFAALNLSRSESFSRTVLEASACGLPVIATRSGGPAEIIVDGQTGFLIPVGDAQACAQAMRALCDDPVLAGRMRKAGRARVMESFAPEAFAKRLRALIAGEA